jgi:hypothetical protein
METEVTYIQRERDWLSRAIAEGRLIDSDRLLPVLPPSIAGNGNGSGNGHGHAHSSGAGSAHHK